MYEINIKYLKKNAYCMRELSANSNERILNTYLSERALNTKIKIIKNTYLMCVPSNLH